MFDRALGCQLDFKVIKLRTFVKKKFDLVEENDYLVGQ